MSNKYKRLEGLADALKEGFTHTNRARVEMSPEEEMEQRKLRPERKMEEKEATGLEPNVKALEDPEPRKKVVPKKKPKEIKEYDSTEV